MGGLWDRICNALAALDMQCTVHTDEIQVTSAVLSGQGSWRPTVPLSGGTEQEGRPRAENVALGCGNNVIEGASSQQRADCRCLQPEQARRVQATTTTAQWQAERCRGSFAREREAVSMAQSEAGRILPSTRPMAPRNCTAASTQARFCTAWQHIGALISAPDLRCGRRCACSGSGKGRSACGQG